MSLDQPRPPFLRGVELSTTKKQEFDDSPLSLVLRDEDITENEKFSGVKYLLSLGVEVFFEDIVDAGDLHSQDIVTLLLLHQNIIYDAFGHIVFRLYRETYYKKKLSFIRKFGQKKKYQHRTWSTDTHRHFPAQFQKLVIFLLYLRKQGGNVLSKIPQNMILRNILPYFNEFEVVYYFTPKKHRILMNLPEDPYKEKLKKKKMKSHNLPFEKLTINMKYKGHGAISTPTKKKKKKKRFSGSVSPSNVPRLKTPLKKGCKTPTKRKGKVYNRLYNLSKNSKTPSPKKSKSFGSLVLTKKKGKSPFKNRKQLSPTVVRVKFSDTLDQDGPRSFQSL